MTIRALVGLGGLAAWYTLIGLLVLWAFGVIDTRRRIARYAGLGFLIGFALTGLLWTFLLIIGVPLTGFTIVGVLALQTIALGVIGRRFGRALPVPAAPGRWLTYPNAIGIAITGLFFEALFAASRLQGLQAYDAWAFWIPKAKALFFFDGLDHHFFSTLAGPSYPPLLPIMNSSAFHAMGGVDVVTLHVQFWLIAVAFVWAVAGLLHDRVPPWILWPTLLLLLVAPRVGGRLVTPLSDIPLDVSVAVAVALLVLWLDDSRIWRLWVAALLLAGAADMKREGLLLGVCVIAATVVASARRPRQALLGAAILGSGLVATFVPWRILVAARDLPGEGPDSTDRADRAWPAIRLALDVLFDSGLWSLLPTLTLAAVLLALLARRFKEAIFAAVVLVTACAGGAWIVWLYPELPLDAVEATNPIVRYTLAQVMIGAVLTAWLLASIWRDAPGRVAEKEKEPS